MTHSTTMPHASPSSPLDMLILGSGPAGCSAAIYAARSGLKPYMWSGLQPGGQLTITTDVENYPGFAEPIMGPWLVEQMSLQAQRVGVVSETRLADTVDLSSWPFLVTDDHQNHITTKTLIIATGAKARWLGLENESRLMGKGVSGCATCDGFFFRNQTVGVVGGGNTAAEEALFLTKHAEKVILIHRRNSLRAEHILASRLLNHPKIEILWNTRLLTINGDHSLESVLLENVHTHDQRTLPLHGLFVAIGHDPATSLFKNTLLMDREGYILTKPESTRTSVEGVFAAGDAADKIYRQAVTAAGTGCMAALDAVHFLETSPLETSSLETSPLETSPLETSLAVPSSS